MHSVDPVSLTVRRVSYSIEAAAGIRPSSGCNKEDGGKRSILALQRRSR